MKFFLRTCVATAIVAGGQILPRNAGAQTLTTLYQFTGHGDGGHSTAGLIAVGGTFYGTTNSGGATGAGAVFAFDLATNTEISLYSFRGGADGADPSTGLVYHDGILYGATEGGGTGGKLCRPERCGTVFAIDRKSGAESIIYKFRGPFGGAFANQVIYKNGHLYVTTDAAAFRLDVTTGHARFLHSFIGTPDGYLPEGGLIYLNGSLYGTTEAGGAVAGGTVYKLNPKSGAESVLYSFMDGKDGAYPKAGLIYEGGFLYGTTSGADSTTSGTVFKVDPKTGAESVIHIFTGGLDGAFPLAPLIYQDGFLYGTTFSGGGSGCDGNGCGTLFNIDLASGTETLLYSFTGKEDGANPMAPLLYHNGAFYGTTSQGGTSGCGGLGCGTIFQLAGSNGRHITSSSRVATDQGRD